MVDNWEDLSGHLESPRKGLGGPQGQNSPVREGRCHPSYDTGRTQGHKRLFGQANYPCSIKRETLVVI